MIMPDIMEINIDLNYTDKNEQEALNRLSAGIDGQIQSIVKAGFVKDKIKLCEFSIDEISNWESNKYKITGYKATQSIKILLPIIEKELIDGLMANLTINKNENVSIRIDAVLSEELNNKIKNELIKKAIADATEKAQIIAESLMVKLGSVKSVEYGELWYLPRARKSIRFSPPEIRSDDESVVRDSSAYQLLGISETELTEKIHVIWYIE
jgi:uncharacterized protein